MAYATVGSGPALIFAQTASHLELEWEEPRIRDFWDTIGRHHKVVRYDTHGCGLSDRNRNDFSLDSEIQPIEAIVKELGLKSFVLWARSVETPTAIAYAVKYPDRVSHLILYGAQARWHGHPAWGGISQEIHRALVLSNWRTSQLALAEGMLGSAFDASALQWFLRYRQEATTPEIVDKLLTFWWNTDVRDLLPKVSVPTLVLHYRNDRIIPFEAGREVAAGIPGARFVPLEGDVHYFFFGNTRPLLRAMAEFLGDPIEDVERPSSDAAKVPSALETAQGVFRKEGEFWTIACCRKVFRLKDVRGLAYIAYLLGHPGEEFHVLSLASKNGGKQGEADALAEPTTEEQATRSDLSVGRIGDAGEMLDSPVNAASPSSRCRGCPATRIAIRCGSATPLMSSSSSTCTARSSTRCMWRPAMACAPTMMPGAC
jgi:pimeloyl-ACP methyl ester carboxylesterase